MHTDHRSIDELAETRHLAAMLAVHGEIAQGGPLEDVLGAVARYAAGVVTAQKASVILIRDAEHYKLVGRYGLSDGYARMLDEAPLRLQHGRGPSGLAVETGEPVVISDTETDERFVTRRPLSRREGYRAMVSTPLVVDGETIGTLNVYRAEPAAWSSADIDMLVLFAGAAARATYIAQLMDRQSRQLSALQRLVHALREQAHEHANRLHTIGGLLALGDIDEASRYIMDVGLEHKGDAADIERRIAQPTVAGLILAESAIGRQRGIRVALTSDTSLSALPRLVDEGEMLTIIGNLLDNAFHAVAAMPKHRRRVDLRIVGDRQSGLQLTVSDNGPGIAEEIRDRLFAVGASTKDGHPGLGLALVRAAVDSAFGTIDVSERKGGGTVVRVLVPGG